MKKNLTDLLKALKNGKLPSKHFQVGNIVIFEGNEPGMELNAIDNKSVVLSLKRSTLVSIVITYTDTGKFKARVSTVDRVYLDSEYQCPMKTGKAVNALLRTF